MYAEYDPLDGRITVISFLQKPNSIYIEESLREELQDVMNCNLFRVCLKDKSLIRKSTRDNLKNGLVRWPYNELRHILPFDVNWDVLVSCPDKETKSLIVIAKPCLSHSSLNVFLCSAENPDTLVQEVPCVTGRYDFKGFNYWVHPYSRDAGLTVFFINDFPSMLLLLNEVCPSCP